VSCTLYRDDARRSTQCVDDAEARSASSGGESGRSSYYDSDLSGFMEDSEMYEQQDEEVRNAHGCCGCD
jgi:hypothetical protein